MPRQAVDDQHTGNSKQGDECRFPSEERRRRNSDAEGVRVNVAHQLS